MQPRSALAMPDHQLGSNVPCRTRGPRPHPAPTAVGLYSYALRTSTTPNHPRRIHCAGERPPPSGGRACWRGPGTRTVDSPHQNTAPTAPQHHCHGGTADVCVRPRAFGVAPLSRESSAGRLQPCNDPSCAVPQAPRRLPATSWCVVLHPPPPPPSVRDRVCVWVVCPAQPFSCYPHGNVCQDI